MLWVALDAIVTGNPLYSLHSTAGLAQELGRTQGFSSVVASVWTYAVRIDKLPVMLGALVGVPLAIWLRRGACSRRWRRSLLLLGVFVAGGRGRRVGDRPLPAGRARPCCCCSAPSRSAAGRCSSRGSTLRRVWMVGAAALRRSTASLSAATTLSLSSLRTTLAYHEDFHKGLAVALRDPRGEGRAAALSAACRCRTTS